MQAALLDPAAAAAAVAKASKGVAPGACARYPVCSHKGPEGRPPSPCARRNKDTRSGSPVEDKGKLWSLCPVFSAQVPFVVDHNLADKGDAEFSVMA